MPKEFYTEKDIEDMFKRGVMALEVHDDVVLTEMAYEKARSVGMKLLCDKPDNPPSAPVRPYISQKKCRYAATPVTAPVPVPPPSPDGASPAGRTEETGLQQRIRNAIVARMGTQVDSNLLDVIIHRVLASTGAK